MINNFRNCIVMKFRICCFSVISFYSTTFLGVLRYYYDQCLGAACCKVPATSTPFVQKPMARDALDFKKVLHVLEGFCYAVAAKKTREMDDSNMRVPKNIGLFHHFPPMLIYFQQNVRRRQFWKYPQV